MSQLSVLPKKKLRELIKETELTLYALRSELEKRDDVEQYREIGRLEEHMKSAELSLTTIKDFFHYLLEDIKKK